MIPHNFNLNFLFSTLALTGMCLLTNLPSLKAQTPAENLQKAVEIYNALREYTDGLNSKTLTDDQISDVKSRMDKAIPLLDQVIREGNAEEIRTARYFRTNFKYEYGFILGMKGQNARDLEILQEIERDMTNYSASDFPLKYQYFDKTYVIKWDNFAPTQAEYYTGYAEVAYNLGKYQDALRLNRLALAHPNTNAWLKYIAVNKMLDIYNKNQSYLTEVELLDFAVQAVKSYYALTETDHQTIEEHEYATPSRGLGIIIEKAQKNVPAALARAGDAALAGMADANSPEVLALLEICYKNKQATTPDFNIAAEKYARGMRAADNTNARYVGVAATDRLALAASSTDCAALVAIIDDYNYWNESAKAAEFSKKRQQCLDDAEKAAKKAARIARRADNKFNLYAGIYVLPLLKDNAHRDYGGVLNFSFKKVALEFSYLKIKLNKENVADLALQGVSDVSNKDISRWNGYYAHFQPKFYSGKGVYFGPLLGYAQKDFEETSANVTRDADGMYSSQTFKPAEKQYILMANFGMMGLAKGAGVDFYMGVGGTYNQWDWGNALNNDEYTVDNAVLENRKKDFFNFIVRVGLTVGLNFGKGNL